MDEKELNAPNANLSAINFEDKEEEIELSDQEVQQNENEFEMTDQEQLKHKQHEERIQKLIVENITNSKKLKLLKELLNSPNGNSSTELSSIEKIKDLQLSDNDD